MNPMLGSTDFTSLTGALSTLGTDVSGAAGTVITACVALIALFWGTKRIIKLFTSIGNRG